ncbi:tRNA (guanine(10)-N2)-methyltransferase homolog isoform X1 [Amphibalanus amphitrite]|nr:tRNA (guanine(10)-N2)-methyltransferase homolog isoform X1 [Amphibalanus amphitrite]XP_043199075.1 tRNA (guanine(10)-N2)-methyltransferase homolog isoform X1 [Amphibalanus amphitrite]XP_043199076.1 tRNA (guanine(10)-N2)-methyltransferase homolog isoform X1 [Amphibalanus amphitrite]XP_043199077.1 tRNA (guanine(10)-N2)-methyltransferase homolog isoform X1 [Amphibalanus amphitrite]XP_043199078.1 tRNA (guanine(10)-N2)-methyltransferase homolog isoform X1 [Amphibalanus amphitrite]XP_043199080.1 
MAPVSSYLLWFSNELTEFREPELRSVLSLLDVRCRWTPQSAQEPFLVVEFDSEADACAVARRTVAVKACVELWAAADTEDELHRQLRRRLEDHPETVLPHLSADTYRVNVDAFSKNLTYEDKLARIEAITDVLPLTGAVRLRDSELCLQLIEHYGSDSNQAPLRPLRLYFGRWLCDGPRATITQHSLKRRAYIGNTSMDPELALIMANMARVGPGRLVLDPFVGTGSLLVAAAHFGGYVLGADIDSATVHARTRPSRVQERGRRRGEHESIAANLRQYGLHSRLVDVLVADAARPDVWRRGVTVDAIVTDPPYGIREVSQAGYCAGALFADLLQLAAERLTLGGRLVFWLPVARAEYAADQLPRHDCLRLVANSEQPLTSRASRRLITMEKWRELTEAERGRPGATVHPSMDLFQERYYSPRPVVPPGRAATGAGDNETERTLDPTGCVVEPEQLHKCNGTVEKCER